MAGTINPWNNTIASANSAITLNAGTNAINIGSDASANSINIATGLADKTIVVGNINSTASMTFLNGDGNIILDKSSATGAVTIGDGTANFTINIGRGGSKTINMGSYNTTTFDIRGSTIPIAGNIVTVGHQATYSSAVTLGSPVTTSSTTIYSGSSGLTIDIPNAVINMNSGTGTIGISNDAFNTTVNVGTGAGVKTSTFGSTNSTSATTVQSGSGALNVTSTNGAITINSGTGTVAIGSDATGATYNFATGAGAKVVTVGSTNSTSSLALQYGTSDFTLASATGTIMSALDSGEITYPLQPAFFAILPSQVTNVTGNGTVYTLGTGTALTEIYDRNSDFNTNGTFTAPVTGIYTFYCSITFVNSSGGGTEYAVSLVTSNRTYILLQSPTRSRVTNFFGPNGYISYSGSVIADMDAADTATITVIAANGTLTSSVLGAASPYTWFGGNLTC